MKTHATPGLSTKPSRRVIRQRYADLMAGGQVTSLEAMETVAGQSRLDLNEVRHIVLGSRWKRGGGHLT